jgi:Gluconate 2-dehydrogenase subunit 3
MRRRGFITILGLGFLGGATALWRTFWQPRFDKHTAQTVTVVTDLMFPGDGGLPGATELKIHDRLIAMADLHEAMAYGVAWLDVWAKSNGASDFLSLDEEARTAAIEAAFASEIEDARQFAILLRYHGGLNYYSEPRIKETFHYTGPPQPEGFPDFQDPPQ